MFGEDTKKLRSKLFNLCNDKKLSANATSMIMDGGVNYFRFGMSGEIEPIGDKWQSLEQYVVENASHLEHGNDNVIGLGQPLSEKKKLFLLLDEHAKNGNMAGYRAVRKQYKEAVG